jgi:hypothetical protein
MDHPSVDSMGSNNQPFAIFAPPKYALQIADEIKHRLVNCDDTWLPSLPELYRLRTIALTTFATAKEERSNIFVKPVQKGLFAPDIYSPGSLKRTEPPVPSQTSVYLSEPVQWLTEFRCFVAQRKIVAMAPYRIGAQRLTQIDDPLPATLEESNAARDFCEELLADRNVPLPPGVVIDVGRIKGKGWAVVEANEAWASSIYSCAPEAVLNSLLSCCIPSP